MKTVTRKFLIVMLIVAMFLQPVALTTAEAKSSNKRSSNSKIVVMECSRSGTRVKFPKNNLKVPNGQVILSYRSNNTGYIFHDDYTIYFEVTRKNRLYLEVYPGDGVGMGFPGREYVLKKNARRIGHSNIYVYGWIIRGKIKDYYRHNKHYVEFTMVSSGRKQKIRFVHKGKTWTLTALH